MTVGRLLRRLTPAGLLWTCLLGAAAPAHAGSAKILLYHHISADTPASTSVTPSRFDEHLDLLAREGYEVVPLQQIVDHLVNGKTLESNWVAITFDDAYRSVLTEAFPRLEKRGWPFTIFVSTGFVDEGFGLYLSWDELRTLEQSGVTIANHTISHGHMVRMQDGESYDDWLRRLSADVIGAQNRLEEELDAPPRLFAYPYGEFDQDVADLMRSLGFIALGQQSGPVGETTHHYAIPRFPLGTGFDSVASLHEKLRTEHLPMSSRTVPAAVLEPDAGAPLLTLTLKDPDIRQGSLTCFVAGQPRTTVIWQDATTVEVTAERPLSAGRSKYTCTAPHPTIPRAYYWHTQLWIKPRADGSWYDG